MTGSAEQTHDADGDREANLESGVPQGRAPSAATTGSRAHHEANEEKSKLWDVAKKLTLIATMGWMSGGYAKHNSKYRATAFGHLAAYNAEKAAESWPDREAATTSIANAIGTAVWAGGIGTGNKVALTLGPALNATANLTSAAMKYSQGKAGWARDLVDVSEMAAFTGAGMTANPVARALAFSAAGAGFFWDAVEARDKSLVGHGVGTLVWAVGAGVDNYSWQAAGAGAVALSEFARLTYPYLESLAGDSPSEATPERPGDDERTVGQETALTGVSVPAPVPGSSVADAASHLLPSGRATEMANSQNTPRNPITGTAPLSLPTSPAALYAYAPPTRTRSQSAPASLRSMTGEGASTPTSTTRPQVARGDVQRRPVRRA
ncbi:hypothetical protein [Streptomyces sp. CoH17]|uniref:hypothetical protein n=1 Tax=Streptomyces sp. CoH17 TaxID=2992806 RepID=UPI002271CC44|nr:hypothetical protein [Streptomyces sp. CoH17]